MLTRTGCLKQDLHRNNPYKYKSLTTIPRVFDAEVFMGWMLFLSSPNQ